MSVCDTYLDDQEHNRVRQAVRAAGHELVDARGNASPALAQFSQSAQQHKRQHGGLEGWVPGTAKLATPQAIWLDATKAKASINREAAKAAKAAGHVSYRATPTEVAAVVRAALEFAEQASRPSGRNILRAVASERGHSEEWVCAVAKKPSRKHVAAALEANRQHPTIQLLERQGMLSSHSKRDISGATLSTTVKRLYDLRDVAARFQQLEGEVAQLRTDLNEVRAVAQAANQRCDIIEAGKHWHDVARAMRESGQSYGAIAKHTGQSRSSVSSYLTRLAQRNA